MPLSLYCGPTVIQHYTHRSPEAAERICRMALGRSSQVQAMRVSDIQDVLEANTGYVTLNHKHHDEYVGLPVISHKVLQIFTEDRGGWSALIIKYPGDRSTHAVIVSNNEYRDNSKKGKWQPITRLRGARLVDMWAMGRREEWQDETKAQEASA